MSRTALLAAAIATALAPVALSAQPAHCPPGLAKKGSCVPPGLRRQGVTEREWMRGDRLDRDGDYWERINRADYDLPPLDDDEDYVRVENRIAKIARDSLEILAFVGIVAAASRAVQQQKDAQSGAVEIIE